MHIFIRTLFVIALLLTVMRVNVWAQPADPHAHHVPAPAGDEPMPLTLEHSEASGTSWLPRETPASGAMWHRGPWMLMLHGNVFVQHIEVTGERGARQTGSINWLMGMASRPLGGGRMTARIMSSIEPVTVGRCGYPDLVQSGESCRGVPLHDRQHPHDLFMELAAHYVRPIGGGLSIELYGGPAGEPALGPVAYPHRLSAMLQPLAPVTHHWLDATHVTFGVATVGISGRRWKVEGSAFNGREPDDKRYGLDLARLDSVSGRVWWMPTRRWAVQASTAVLADAHHGEDTRRTTASVTYHRDRAGRMGANTVAWGMNRDDHASSHAALFESAIDVTTSDSVSLRAEIVTKTAGDLSLPDDAHGSFTLTKVQGVYTRRFAPRFGFAPGVGAGAGFARLPASLGSVYGTRTPLEFSVFVTLAPAQVR